MHVRYIYSVARAAKPPQVFAQMLMGFELASRDPRVVGLNLVQPDDSFVPMHDFRLHMQMLNYLKSVYPNVHIAPHAGGSARPVPPMACASTSESPSRRARPSASATAWM